MYATTFVLLMATMLGPPAETSAERSTRIYVRTTPPGASIVVDGKELGTSDGLFLVPPGVRTITLEMDGYDPEAKRVDVREGWITRVEVTMNRGGTKPDRAGQSASKSESLYFVRWVIQDEKTMTFEGEPVTLDQLPSLLEKVPNRAQTVLEMGYSTDISVKLRDEYVARAGALAHKLGFRHASDIGQQKLGSKGSPPQALLGSKEEKSGSADRLSQVEQELLRDKIELEKLLLHFGTGYPRIHELRARIKAGEEYLAIRKNGAEASVRPQADPDHLFQVELELLRHKTELEKELQHYGEQHPKIGELRARIKADFESAKAEVLRLIDEHLAGLKLEAESAGIDFEACSRGAKVSVPVGLRRFASSISHWQLERAKVAMAREGREAVPYWRSLVLPRIYFDRTVHDLDEGQGQEAIDLDTGALHDIPKEIEKWTPAQRDEWFEDRGIDLVTDHASNQWALGLVAPAVTLVPADDVKLHEANERVAEVLGKKDERLKGITIHREEGIDFLLLPKDCKPPVNFAFRTAQGTEGFLQIVELNEDKPKSMRLRWNVTKAVYEAGFFVGYPLRTIHLPDADTKDTVVVLDLASGEMLKLPWESEDTSAAFQETDQDTRHFTKLGKGDLAFDRQLFCLRGGTIELAAEDAGQELNMTSKKDDAKAYQLPKLPCELLVTTPEKQQFVVKILDETQAGGLNLKYRQIPSTWAGAGSPRMSRRGPRPGEGEAASSKGETLQFVRWVIEDEKTMTFEGTPVTLDGLSSLLEKTPNRAQTILEVGYSSEISVKLRDDCVGRAAILAQKLGFKHASDIGQQKLGSKGSPPQAASDQAAGVPNPVLGLEPPAAVVREFLEAMRAGDNAKAASLFAPAARAKIKELGYLMAPEKSSTATFAVGDVTHLEDGESRVSGSWTDYGRTDQMIWILRSGDEGWRIVGMETLASDGVPALVLDFENLEEATKNILVWAEGVKKEQEAKTTIYPPKVTWIIYADGTMTFNSRPTTFDEIEEQVARIAEPERMMFYICCDQGVDRGVRERAEKMVREWKKTYRFQGPLFNYLHNKLPDMSSGSTGEPTLYFERTIHDLAQGQGREALHRDQWKVTKTTEDSRGPAVLDPDLEKEFSLVVRAGRNELPSGEKQSLQAKNHPLLAQLADSNTVKLIRWFAELPDAIHDELKNKGYVKWKFAYLNEGHQKIARDIIQLNVDMARQGTGTRSGLSVEALEDSELGFAMVEVEQANQKVVSWFVLLPKWPTPIWVTVVNVQAAGTQPCFQAHLKSLPLLKERPETSQTDRDLTAWRKIQLPDADTKDTPVVVDLASGEMLKVPWESEDTSAAPQETDQDAGHFTKLGKGDLAFDHQLFCLRGGTIELAAEDAGQELNMTGKKDDTKAYQLPKLPCELLVTTPENRQFVVKILDETPASGLNLEYRQVKGMAKQQADSTEPQPDAGPRDLEGRLQEADVQMAPECGVLDFRIAASEEEGKTFAETEKGLGWYDASPWMNDTAGLVTREAEGRTQILLWQTAEKSLTASEPNEKKWHIVEVSVIAEVDRPGRLGVVFDVEGGRRLRELTTANIDRRLAVVVDGHVVGCPIVRSPIGERVEITGSFSKAELARLATALQAGMEAKQS